MTTLTLRLPKALAAELAAVSKRRRASQTAISREALREHLARQAAEPTREYFEKYLREHGEPAPESFAAQAAKYTGCIDFDGPADLSTNPKPLEWFGECPPLVASLYKRDKNYLWVKQTTALLPAPFFTGEAVLTKACFLTKRLLGQRDPVVELVENGLVRVDFNLNYEISDARKLLLHYADVPMSLAAACLVQISELHSNSLVLTTDSDFNIYRKHCRQLFTY